MLHQQISTGIALVYKGVFGRGPTKTTLHVAGDVVLCVLEDARTPGQERLTAIGGHEIVHAAQLRLQKSMEPELSALVEEATGRRVRGCVSGYDAELGAATHTFLLVPQD
ncbi:Na-translocating system protein MpsC family protein [Patulibacter sp. S7RM1-6]